MGKRFLKRKHFEIEKLLYKKISTFEANLFENYIWWSSPLINIKRSGRVESQERAR